MFPWMIKLLFTEINFLTVSHKFSLLYLPKYFYLKNTQFKNPPTECRQSINYAIDETHFMQNIDWLLKHV